MRLDLILAPALFLFLCTAAVSVDAVDCDNCTVDANSTANATNETDIPPEPEEVFERVLYKIFFPHSKCQGGAESDVPRPDPLNVSLPTNTSYYTLQEVMEAATDQDLSYQFSLLYPSEDAGYLLEGINGTEDEGNCRWRLYYQPPGEGEPTLLHDAPTSADQLQVELINVEPNSTVVLCYQDISPADQPTSSSVATPVVTSADVTEPSSSSAVPVQPVPTTTTTTTTTSTSSSSTESSTEPTSPASSAPPEVTESTSPSLPVPTMRTGSAHTISISIHTLSLIMSIAILCLYIV